MVNDTPQRHRGHREGDFDTNLHGFKHRFKEYDRRVTAMGVRTARHSWYDPPPPIESSTPLPQLLQPDKFAALLESPENPTIRSFASGWQRIRSRGSYLWSGSDTACDTVRTTFVSGSNRPQTDSASLTTTRRTSLQASCMLVEMTMRSMVPAGRNSGRAGVGSVGRPGSIYCPAPHRTKSCGICGVAKSKAV